MCGPGAKWRRWGIQPPLKWPKPLSPKVTSAALSSRAGTLAWPPYSLQRNIGFWRILADLWSGNVKIKYHKSTNEHVIACNWFVTKCFGWTGNAGNLINLNTHSCWGVLPSKQDAENMHLFRWMQRLCLHHACTLHIMDNYFASLSQVLEKPAEKLLQILYTYICMYININMYIYIYIYVNIESVCVCTSMCVCV